MEPVASITTVAHVIQLAVAPAFLLTGAGAILAVLTNRLGRVVDRFRVLERSLAETRRGEQAVYKKEMARLSRRARMIQWAITFCTIGALLVCTVIASLFIGAVTDVDLSGTIAAIFIAAMLAMIVGLLILLREISLATGGVHVVGQPAVPGKG